MVKRLYPRWCRDNSGKPNWWSIQFHKILYFVVIQWFVRKSREGFVALRAAQPWTHSTAGEESLNIIYPNITASSTAEISYTFLISGFDVYPSDNLTTILALPGFKSKVNVNVDFDSEIFFYNISDGAVNLFCYFSLT